MLSIMEPELAQHLFQRSLLMPPSILIVEDEQVVAMDIELMLHQMGHHVVGIASSGRVAIDLATQMRPNLILMDVHLEGNIDGIEAATQIQAILDVPIIYLTAYADEMTLRRARATHPYGYLVKPFDDRTVQTTIDMAIVRHQLDQQVRANNQWFATTLNSIDKAVITTDSDANVTYVNPAAASILRIDPKGVLGQSITRVMPIFDASSRTQLPHPALIVLAANRPVSPPGPVLFVAADGTEQVIEVSIRPITLSADTVIGTVMVLREAKTQAQLEAERLERLHQQEQIRHLERLRIMSGGLADDLNNLLTGIIGYTDMARTELNDKHPASAMLDQVAAISQQAAALTHQLLLYAGRASQRFGPLDLNRLISETIERLPASMVNRVALDLQLTSNLPPFNGDSLQMRQVILSLLLNAAEAIGESGRISVTTGTRRISGLTRTQTTTGIELPPGVYLTFEVQDTGAGMEEATLRRIFEPFFSTRGTGRGLGLASVVGNLREHKGTVNVRSEPGKGTVFSVLLPVSAPELPMPIIPSDDLTEWRGRGMIIVIDDDPIARTVAGRYVERLGFKAILAEDGRSGIDKIRDLGGVIGGVLLDLTMPGMHGMEVARELRIIDPDVPIVLMSAYENPDNLTLAGNPTIFLSKPFTLASLRACLSQVMVPQGR